MHHHHLFVHSLNTSVVVSSIINHHQSSAIIVSYHPSPSSVIHPSGIHQAFVSHSLSHVVIHQSFIIFVIIIFITTIIFSHDSYHSVNIFMMHITSSTISLPSGLIGNSAISAAQPNFLLAHGPCEQPEPAYVYIHRPLAPAETPRRNALRGMIIEIISGRRWQNAHARGDFARGFEEHFQASAMCAFRRGYAMMKHRRLTRLVVGVRSASCYSRSGDGGTCAARFKFPFMVKINKNLKKIISNFTFKGRFAPL